jgi:lipoprotein-anchoring transpeptidase ErfK/SrfK
MQKYRRLLTLAIACALLSGCGAPPKKPAKNSGMIAATVGKKTGPRTSYWIDEELSGPAKIVISISEQRTYFYKGNKIAGEANISTGKQGFDTPPGKYAVNQKDDKHISNLYGNFVDAEGNIVKKDVDMSKEPEVPEGLTFAGAKMPYFLRFTEGYGLHAGRLPGYRASHGCIRMSATMAKHFFENAEIGTPVMVQE